MHMQNSSYFAPTYGMVSIHIALNELNQTVCKQVVLKIVTPTLTDLAFL